jgi:hypothetical protein
MPECNGYTAHQKHCGLEPSTVSTAQCMNFIKTMEALLTLENLTAMRFGWVTSGFLGDLVFLH